MRNEKRCVGNTESTRMKLWELIDLSRGQGCAQFKLATGNGWNWWWKHWKHRSKCSNCCAVAPHRWWPSWSPSQYPSLGLAITPNVPTASETNPRNWRKNTTKAYALHIMQCYRNCNKLWDNCNEETLLRSDGSYRVSTTCKASKCHADLNCRRCWSISAAAGWGWAAGNVFAAVHLLQHAAMPARSAKWSQPQLVKFVARGLAARAFKLGFTKHLWGRVSFSAGSICAPRLQSFGKRCRTWRFWRVSNKLLSWRFSSQTSHDIPVLSGRRGWLQIFHPADSRLWSNLPGWELG